MRHPFPDDGRYEIRGTLGAGGFGSVYRAFDRVAGREVAIKVSHTRADPVRLERLRREGELTARLDHPGIVRVHSAGEVRGYPYLVYGLVEGQSLGERLPRTHLRRRVELVRDTARALGFAHAQGIVHRDVKAENVLVDEDGKVHVADFGLASAQDLESLTKTGQLLGTPSHMAPEQVQDRQRIGPATDVWSLGVLLYQALTDALPFEADNELALIGQILQGKIEPPRQVNPRAPRELEAVCLKALRRRPGARYPDGEALAADLDRWLDGELPRLGRRPWGWIALGVGLLLVGAAAVWQRGEGATAPTQPDGLDVASLASDRVSRRAARERRAKEQAARVRLRELEALPPRSAERREGLRRWVREQPDHPELARAQLALRASELAQPEVVLPHLPAPRPDARIEARWLDHERVLTHGPGGRLRCWRLGAAAVPLWEASAGPNGGGFALTRDRRQILVPQRGVLLVIEAGSGELTRRPLASISAEDFVRETRMAPDGQTLFVSTNQAGVLAYDWPTLDRRLRLEQQRVRALAVSPDGRLLVGGGSTDGKYSFLMGWRLPGGELVWETKLPVPPTALGFAPDGATLLVGSSTGRLDLCRARDGRSLRTLVAPDGGGGGGGFEAQVGHRGHVSGIAASRDGSVFYSVCYLLEFGESRPELRAWSHPSGELLQLRVRAHPLRSLELSPDGARLLLGTDAGTAEILPAAAE